MQFGRFPRREFITLLGGVAAYPLAARGQTAVPVVGFLHYASPGEAAQFVARFRDGLSESGFHEGRNVAIEYRWEEGQGDRLPSLVADLANRQVAVILAAGPAIAVAVKAASTTIPIVFITGTDPVKLGLVASLARPGGNATGVNFFNAEIEAKRVGLLHELVPRATLIAVLRNPTRPDAEEQLRDLQEAMRTLGRQILLLDAGTGGEIDTAFATLAGQRADALTVAADPFFTARRDHIIALAARQALPTIFGLREFAVAGGLISYSASLSEAYRQVGVYTGRILKGTKPADLPVMLPSKFELVINLRTAKTLGLTIPPGVLAIADEVIE